MKLNFKLLVLSKDFKSDVNHNNCDMKLTFEFLVFSEDFKSDATGPVWEILLVGERDEA